jgi:hypothetical protein
MSAMPSPGLTIRSATAEDERALANLARRARPRGPALIAELDGIAVAALSLTTGAVMTDPMVPTGALVREMHARVAAHTAAASSQPRPAVTRPPAIDTAM